MGKKVKIDLTIIIPIILFAIISITTIYSAMTYSSSDLGNNTSNSKKGYTLKSPNNSMQFNGVNNLNNSPKTYKYTPKNINTTPQPNYNNVNYNNNDVMVLTIE